MKNDTTAEPPPARKRLRQSPLKTSHPGFVSWKEVSSEPNATGFRGSMLEQVEEMCRKDDRARLREFKRMRKEIQSARKELQGIMNRLDNLRDEVEYLREQEDDAREQGGALRRLPADHFN